MLAAAAARQASCGAAFGVGVPSARTRRFCGFAVHVRGGGAGGADPRRGAEPARLAVGRRDGRQRARRVHRERSGVGQRGGRRRGGSAGHGPRQVCTGCFGNGYWTRNLAVEHLVWVIRGNMHFHF